MHNIQKYSKLLNYQSNELIFNIHVLYVYAKIK